MSPEQHLEWIDDDVAWFSSLTDAVLDVPVPATPPWTVGDVHAHLAFGLGVGYPMALRAAPHATHVEAFADLALPDPAPRGIEARSAFVEHLGACADAFRSVHPDHPCFTYAGPGTAAFWFRRAAIELTLHRLDVAEAIGETHRLPADRLADALAESAEFALPFAASVLGSAPPPARFADSTVTPTTWHHLGDGESLVSVTADGHELLAGLWGRRAEVGWSGDPEVARAWLTLVKRAFG